MLFLPQSVYDSRRRLWNDFEAGKITAEQAFQKMLKLDPDDHIGLVGLGKLRRETGDLAAAEEHFWRAIQAHPCVSSAYIELARMLHQRPESAALSEALGELGVGKRVLEDETFLKGMNLEKLGFDKEALERFMQLPGAAQARLIAKSIRANRGDEPEEVTERLRQLRLIQQMQEEGDLGPETVDAIVGEGESMTPLLVGVLREWAQDLEGDSGASLAENALALLGETGFPSEIPHLLEFVDLEDEDTAGAAKWALGRIIERHSEAAAQFIASIAAGLGPSERMHVTEQILRHPDFDPGGKLLKRLSENIDSWKSAERDLFFPLLLGAMAAARGREGVNLGRAALRQQSGLLSRSARRESDALLTAFQEADVPPSSLSPSPVSVYEICAGNALWGDDEDEEEDKDKGEEELLSAAEPVRRKPAPGRNDPCWCNSGKKYKKCHLESDERGEGAPGGEPTVLRGRNEFAGLRKSLGDFLGKVLPERDLKLALKRFVGDRPEEPQDAAVSVTDWMLHDWAAPSLGRTVMEEFLDRRGSSLTKSEREMVEAWSRSIVGLYEVQELTAGTGFTLKDLIFGQTFFVHDVNMSTRLVRWDGLLARVVPGERGTELTGIGLTVPRHSLEPLRLWMEADREEAGLEWRDYLKENWPRVRRQSFELAENWVESLQLANTDGEEVLFSKAVYQVIDEAAAMEALRRCPEFQSEFDRERESFVWLNAGQTVLGNIRIGTDELVLECNSRERLDRGKLLLLSIAGASLRHLRDEFTTQKELKSRAAAEPRSARRPDQEEIPKEIRDQAIGRFMEEHYRTWPDVKLPALDGKTPRDAVRTEKGRKQVIAVLKSIENGEGRKKQAGEPFYDVARLRAELGLD
jgi:hypothetical protein